MAGAKSRRSAAVKPADLTARLERCYASAVHDVLSGMGRSPCTLPPELRPLDPARKLCGQIFTLSGHIDTTISAHETLLRWTGFLSKVPRDRVVVCQPNTRAVALMGELSAQALMAKGTRGYVVDGHCRDVDFILQLGFPVYCDLNTPVDIVGRWTPDRMGEPITIGAVTICSGDYLLADRDGVVIIPAGIAEKVVAETERVVSTESALRKAILAGMDPQKAYLKYGKF